MICWYDIHFALHFSSCLPFFGLTIYGWVLTLGVVQEDPVNFAAKGKCFEIGLWIWFSVLKLKPEKDKEDAFKAHKM